MPDPVVNAKLPESRETVLSGLRNRLIKGISDISIASTSALRGYLDTYVRHVSPSMASNGDTMFPQTVKRHARFPMNTQHEGKNANLLAFVGITILEYYACILDEKRDMTNLIARVKLVEGIAVDGFASYTVTGTLAQGFTLQKIPGKKAVKK